MRADYEKSIWKYSDATKKSQSQYFVLLGFKHENLKTKKSKKERKKLSDEYESRKAAMLRIHAVEENKGR